MKRRYALLYRLGVTQWDSPQIPSRLAGLPVPPGGAALDLGCGTGTQAIFLASGGWRVTAVDYIPQAIAQARRRPGANAVTWIVADVTSLRLDHTVSLILDNGCLHGIRPARQTAWAATAATAAAAAADDCLLLIRAAPPGLRGPGPRGISGVGLHALLAGQWDSDPAQPVTDDPYRHSFRYRSGTR